MDLTLMDMAERPIVEAVRLEIRHAAGSIEVMAGSAGEARVQHADIDRVGDR